MSQWAMSVSVVSASALLVVSVHSQDMFSTHSEGLRDVTLRFLQRHAVPCRSVTKVESPHGVDETAVCDDGRE